MPDAARSEVAALPTARSALSELRRDMPSTAMESSGYPAAGTSSASPRSPPTKETVAPSARSASATAMAGTPRRAVPPAAITTCGALILAPGARRADGAEVRRSAAGHVEQEAHRAEQDDERGGAGRDERQRHAGERREAENGVDVEQRLTQDQRRQARGEKLRVRADRGLRGPESRIGDHAVEREEAADARQAELLADDRQDEVGVRLRQVEDLLHRLARTQAE